MSSSRTETTRMVERNSVASAHDGSYLALLTDTMQTSLVEIFGDPTHYNYNYNHDDDDDDAFVSDGRILVSNSSSGVDADNIFDSIPINPLAPGSGTDKLLDIISDKLLFHTNTSNNKNISDIYVDDVICFKECVAPNINSTIAKTPSGGSIGDDGTICWEECVDASPPKLTDDCWNSCHALNPSMIAAVQSLGPIDTVANNITNITVTNNITNVTEILREIRGIHFGSKAEIAPNDLEAILDSHHYDVLCWEECRGTGLGFAPTPAPQKTIKDLIDESRNVSSDFDDDDWNPNNLSDGEILRQTLTVYGSFFLICLVSFCILRKLYKRAYNLRSGWIDEAKVTANPIARNPKSLGWVAWMWKIWLVSDYELSDDCGMDALCLCRVLEWGVRITAFGSLVGCLMLMPVYATAGGVHDGETGIERLNTSNVPDGSNGHLIATVVAAYLIFGYVMYTTLDEFEWFYRFRRQFLQRPIPRNYTIFVRFLAKQHRTKKALIDYFSHFEDPTVRLRDEEKLALLVNGDANHETTTAKNPYTKAWVALKIPRLKKLVDKRTALLGKLEHQINIQEVCHKYPKTRCETTGHIISVVDALFAELQALNAEIKVSIERIEARASLDNPDEYNAEDYQNPYQADGSENGDYRGGHEPENSTGNLFFDTIPISPSTDDVEEDAPVHPANAASIYVSAKEPPPEPISEFSNEDEIMGMEDMEKEGRKVTFSEGTELTDTEDTESKSKPNSLRKISNLARNSVAVVETQVGKVGKAAGTAVNAVGEQVMDAGIVVGTTVHRVGKQAANVATGVVGAILGSKEDDGAPMTAGFVAFSTLKGCQAAKQMIHSNEVFEMEVLEAPGYDDILWHNVGKTHKEIQMGTLLSFVLTALLCLFWTFVIAFIATVSSVQGLQVVVPIIGVWMEEAPWLESVLSQIAPLLIIVADEGLKYILEGLSKLEGPVSGMIVEASLFTKLSCFKIIQTFFINAISGSVVSSLSKIAKQPGELITILANALPNQSAFFIQILLVDTFVTCGMELLRVSQIGTAIVRSLVGPKLTEDERRTTWMGLRPLADPYEFRHAEILGGGVLYFVVFFVYAPLAPITSIFMCTCFLIMGAVYRNQFIFIYPTFPDSGGKIWVQFMQIVPTSLFIGEFTISGFLALKKAPVASTLMLPLIFITLLFNIYIREKHFKATEFLPGCECVEADRRNNMDGPMDLRFISNHYLQPELRDKELWPSNASLEMQLKHGIIQPPEAAV